MGEPNTLVSLESSLLAYQPRKEPDATSGSGPFCHVCAGLVLLPSLQSRAGDARWISRITEGHLICQLCARPSHRKCTIGFRDMPYSILMGDVYYEYTCPDCYAKSTPLVTNTNALDSLFRYKIGMNEITLLVLHHLSLTTDSNVLVSANELRLPRKTEPAASTAHDDADLQSPSIKLFHWKTIRDHILLHWYKLWNKNPNKGGPGSWESQLSSTLTNLSGVSFINGKFMANAPGYFGLMPNAKPLPLAEPVLAYRVGPKGELVKCPSLPCSRASGTAGTLSALPAASKGMPVAGSEPISYWNTDFDLPNRPGSVSISKHGDFTHLSHRILEADPLAMPPRPHHTLSKQRGGYRMARASHGVFEGDWYYEIRVPEESGGHVRVGWSLILGDLHAPVGFDEYSYAYGDVTGHSFHTQRPRLFGPAFGCGDVIGVHIHLPPYDASATTSASLACSSAQTLSELQAQIESEYPPLKLGEYKVKLKLHPDSYIAYYKNGSFIGIAFSPVYRGKYYPAFSVYHGNLEICLGPKEAFRHWPAAADQGSGAATGMKAVTDMEGTNEAFDFGVNLTTGEGIQKKRKQRHDGNEGEDELQDVENSLEQNSELLDNGHFSIKDPSMGLEPSVSALALDGSAIAADRDASAVALDAAGHRTDR